MNSTVIIDYGMGNLRSVEKALETVEAIRDLRLRIEWRPKIKDVLFFYPSSKQALCLSLDIRSKAVGEPPFMLAISVREAIRDAVAAFGKSGGQIQLSSPATAEAIFFAIDQRRVRRK